MPSSKQRSFIKLVMSGSSAALSHKVRPNLMVLAWRPMAFIPSSEFLAHMPLSVWWTRSMFPALKSKFSYCSASVSSEESSESSVFVAAVAVRRFCM